jgi:hypothetical protein
MGKFRNSHPDTIAGWLTAKQVGLTYHKPSGEEIKLKGLTDEEANAHIRSAKAVGCWGFVKYTPAR